jgi:transcriptional regulator with XRE-family HTH domain
MATSLKEKNEERSQRFEPVIARVRQLHEDAIAAAERERQVEYGEVWRAERTRPVDRRRIDQAHEQLAQAQKETLDRYAVAKDTAVHLVESLSNDPMHDHIFATAFSLLQIVLSEEREHVSRIRGASADVELPPVGPLLRAMRIHAYRQPTVGYSLRELGAILGRSEGALRHIESGRNEPPFDLVAQWATACGMRLDLRFESTAWGGEDINLIEIRKLVSLLPEDGRRTIRNLADAWSKMPDAIRWDLERRAMDYLADAPWLNRREEDDNE